MTIDSANNTCYIDNIPPTNRSIFKINLGSGTFPNGINVNTNWFLYSSLTSCYIPSQGLVYSSSYLYTNYVTLPGNASGYPAIAQISTATATAVNTNYISDFSNSSYVGEESAFIAISSDGVFYADFLNNGGVSGQIYGLVDFPYPCFKENTKILTNNGYVAVQKLRTGDLVKTLLNGYVPINMVGKRQLSHLKLEDRIADQLYKCSKENYPDVFEDLVITGCHSILVDDFASRRQREKTIELTGNTYVTDRKYRLPACADERATVYENVGDYMIYHIALDNEDYYGNYGIYANGLLVESCSKRYLKELSKMELIE
jgi:hypothetical protein